ncbi:MAG: hypothetical protein HND53_05355 [Proteobacteria bacterium]|nr:hypothetical protein [Pseudomonadota bacterium]NOG59908.1 hypothetical protein [Pseudomonadota bacterium]
MRAERSISQILFGYLPQQTVDLYKNVWKVKNWREPKNESSIDISTVKNALKRAATPWRLTNNDGGYCMDLERGFPLKVLLLDRENGVYVEPFPQTWMCRKCKRIHRNADSRCQCGYSGKLGQLPFVGYHPECGAIVSPWIPQCKEHKQVRVILPGTSSASEIKFECPICEKLIRKGFGFIECQCGKGKLSFNVHRAASVYTPRSVVVVNPPSLEKIKMLRSAGGAAKALHWVINGMKEDSVAEVKSTKSSLRSQLREQGLEESVIDAMIKAAESQQKFDDESLELNLPKEILEDAETDAVSIALACYDSRCTVDKLKDDYKDNNKLKSLYEKNYPLALKMAGLDSVELIDKFPVLTGAYGYTRGKQEPGESRLVPFKNKKGEYNIYADIVETEALLFKLDPIKILKWLKLFNSNLNEHDTPREARVEILKNTRFPKPGENIGEINTGVILLKLIHSFAHKVIRLSAVYSGIDQNALSELLVPSHLGFFVYAVGRGDFVLGGLQALFESELDNLLNDLVNGEHRCPLDPGCRKSGGACMACLHIGEPSCRYFNQYLSRDVLAYEKGYFSFISAQN